MTRLALLLLLCLPLAAEDLPKYVLSAGAGFQTYSDRIVQGWMSVGVKVADKVYSVTTIDMTTEKASMRSGAGYVLVNDGPWRLVGLGDLGVVSGGGTAGAAYSGGGAVFYDISRWTRISGTYAMGAVKIMDSTVTSVKPLFEFGISKTF